jgi:hypothetical protein
MNVWPWSGPAAAMKIFGLHFCAMKSWMNACTVGTSTDPRTTIPGFFATTFLASARRAADDRLV